MFEIRVCTERVVQVMQTNIRGKSLEKVNRSTLFNLIVFGTFLLNLSLFFFFQFYQINVILHKITINTINNFAGKTFVPYIGSPL